MNLDADALRAGIAYQQSLLAALGDDDPAAVQAQAGAYLWALINEAGNDLRTRPAPSSGPCCCASPISPTPRS